MCSIELRDPSAWVHIGIGERICSRSTSPQSLRHGVTGA
jgi:hypothetical protein